ncbi:NB-ARC domain-containing protein [Corchorus olitorius]|uniref:NB-ARC domain-containing protein n=1 Tax=Corchorus olitorius TaxID=93759 RepID=A0A1R3HFI8_9ROSI|nr:NB-ARC domain-containing protein [Corchorus olitorius]
MAEALVSTIIEQLVKIAAENAREEFRLLTGVKTEVKNLASNFKAIQCVLEDAEKKQLVNRSVGHWLERLKQVFYGMQDVIDEWQTALQKEDQVEGFYKKQPRRPESTSFVDVSKLHGRDVVKNHDGDWEPLRATFQQGMAGSKIVVTTRKESVATGLGSSASQVYHLNQLSDEVCWLILSQMAFVGDDDDELRKCLKMLEGKQQTSVKVYHLLQRLSVVCYEGKGVGMNGKIY